LLDAIPDLLFIVDRNGLYSYFKPDIYHELEVPVESVIGKKLEDFFSGEMLAKVKGCILDSLNTSKVQVVDYELQSPKGIRTFEARISPIDKDHILMLVRDKLQSGEYKR
jgi:PAS domain-containing protein